MGADSSVGKHKTPHPTSRTIRKVRQLTELHNLLPLALPLAPKQLDGPGAAGKSAKRNERRKLGRKTSDAAPDEASEESSAWTIASGLSDAELMSPALTPDPRFHSHDHAESLPSLELPPSMPTPDGGEPFARQQSTTSADCDSDANSKGPSSPKPAPKKVSHGHAQNGRRTKRK